MNRLKSAWTLLCIFLFLSSANAPHLFAQVATLRGQLKLHGAPSSSMLPETELLLGMFYFDREIANQKSLSQKDGSFSFTKLPLQENYTYIVKATYEGMDFFSDPVNLTSSSSSPLHTELTIYPVTSSTENIEMTERIFFDLSKESDLIKISHEITLENKGAAAYNPMAEDGQKIVLELLKGSFDLSLGSGLNRSEVDIDEEKSALILRKRLYPDRPGQKFEFSYFYVPDGHHISFPRKLSITRKLWSFSFNSSKPSIKNNLFSWINDNQGPRYEATNLPAGASIDLTISNIPLQKDPYFHALYAGLAFLVFFFGAYIWQQKRNTKQTPNIDPTRLAFEHLQHLTKQYKEGSISKKQFDRQHKELQQYLFEKNKEEDIFIKAS
ncbi:MAG: hypothetical protein R3A11_07085 [Bdellovibrionota bacterium]